MKYRSWQLRRHQPGDVDWIVHRHACLYTQEFGWNDRFEALVAVVARDFLARQPQDRERAWIAHHDGRILGSCANV